MKFDITRLKSGIDDCVYVDESYKFSDDELSGTELMGLDIKVFGDISRNSVYDYNIDLSVKGVMILPCSLTLKPVNYDFETEISGNLAEILEEYGENLKNEQKTIDILPIIWENILMEIPLKVVSDDVSDVVTKGDGWELLIDED